MFKYKKNMLHYFFSTKHPKNTPNYPKNPQNTLKSPPNAPINWTKPKINKIDSQSYMINCLNTIKYILEYTFQSKHPEKPPKLP